MLNIHSAGGGGVPLSGWTAAGETWTYASADDPTFTFTISGDKTGKYSAGMRLNLTQTTVKYFIVTKVAYSEPNTTVTVYGGTDYDLADAAITLPYYSVVKAPFGFPLDPTKWTVEVSDTETRSQASPTQSAWYNLGSVTISIPIGVWSVNYQAALGVDDTSATSLGANKCTLSTANNSESDVDLTSYLTLSGASGTLALALSVFREKVLNLTSKTSYYLNVKTDGAGIGNIYLLGSNSKTIIRAICAYL